MDKLAFIQEFKKTTNDAWLKGWHERNGGNLSYRLTQSEVEQARPFFEETSQWLEIGVTVSNLANEYFIVTGSGKYFRNVEVCIEENAGIIQVSEDGTQYRTLWGLVNNAKPTSELPAHLMNHSVKFDATGGAHRVVMHSHTTNLIALTFVLPLEAETFTRELWEMATECPVVFPAGVGIVPWMVPGGRAIAEYTSELMKTYDVAIWAHHGTFCSAEDLSLAFGLMDTAEKAAEILVKVLAMGGKRQTIQPAEFKELESAFNVTLNEKALA
ncbi:rhamnulose-1-phosphate aldolase [Vibrio methylphosphonaticus]|uniref:rhamnulose-1-phosphate aldolase n=1 Tax=Vibrio methylphosphonaticus TaxID=2946866 RepID=UPI002029F056|nr:rhamnulose-1-phosphate aldolase [Vibrio methylphosphonaticus]MCL9777458.1 rhamnulose-1-phosphate aldolase [Vibrio methylphosphonaticus]